MQYERRPLPAGHNKRTEVLKGLQVRKLTVLSKVYSHKILTYSVLRLRSQLTRLMPILPSRIAPGAGTAAIPNSPTADPKPKVPV